jgi:hypothetical protein
MKRTRKTAGGATPETLLRMYTPERLATAVRVCGALWMELGRRLAALQVAFEACGAGGEAPVLACRARVKLMRGAWRALAPDARALLENPSGDEEHFRWMDEYYQVMKPWLGSFARDLEEYGTTKGDEDPEEGLSFVPEVAVALGRVVEVYDDWSLIAWPLSTIDAPGGLPESEVKRFDVTLKRVEGRMRVRRAAIREEAKRVTP